LRSAVWSHLALVWLSGCCFTTR